MKKWIWITVPAVAVGLGLVFLGGSAFAQNTNNNTTPGVNWTAMYDYCRNVIAGNSTAAGNDFNEMRSYCQNATASGNFGPAGMMGNGGMMNGYTVNGTYGPAGMMGGFTRVATSGPGGMMGNRATGRGMMNW